MTSGVYLDYNASAPLRPEARQAMIEALDLCGNPSSVHGFGRRARAAMEDARERVAEAVGARAENVIFTGGGSEANNLALRGTAAAVRLVSAGEHPSVLAAAPDARQVGLQSDGQIDLERLEQALAQAPQPALVSVMLANNETGVIQPLAEVSRLARQYGAAIHCDAVQAAGRMALDIAELDVDMVSLSAHKLGGPKGIGALVLNKDMDLVPLIAGGGQERRRRAGTENVAGIVAFAAALEAAVDDLAGMVRLAGLRDDLESRLLAAAPGARVFGRLSPRLPNTSCIEMPGVSAELQVMTFDLEKIAVSAGAACASGKVAPSHVLLAMGVSRQSAASAIRLSIGPATTEAELDRFAEVWCDLWSRTAKRRAIA